MGRNDVRRVVFQFDRELLPAFGGLREYQFSVSDYRRAVRVEEGVFVPRVDADRYLVGADQRIAVFFLADAVFLGSPRAQREINDSVVGIAFGDGRSRGLGRADVGNVSAGIFYPSVQCGGPQRERAAEADDAVRAPGAYILAYEQVAASLPTPAMPTSFDSSRAAYCPGLPGRVSATLSVSVVPAMAAPVLPVPQ